MTRSKQETENPPSAWCRARDQRTGKELFVRPRNSTWTPVAGERVPRGEKQAGWVIIHVCEEQDCSFLTLIEPNRGLARLERLMTNTVDADLSASAPALTE